MGTQMAIPTPQKVSRPVEVAVEMGPKWRQPACPVEVSLDERPPRCDVPIEPAMCSQPRRPGCPIEVPLEQSRQHPRYDVEPAMCTQPRRPGCPIGVPLEQLRQPPL